MILSEKKILYIHCPKTGGNSIQNALLPYADEAKLVGEGTWDGIQQFGLKHPTYKQLQKHSSLSRYYKCMGRPKVDSFFKFAVARNPWDLLVSHYFSPYRKVSNWNRDDFIKMVRTIPPLSYYIQHRSLLAHYLKRKGICYENSRPLDADINMLLRFEHLDADYKLLCEKVGLPYEELPKVNQSKRRRSIEYYDGDPELIEMVERKYRKEINFMGYRFEELEGL